MMRLLITGSKGQLGSSIHKLARNYPDFEFIYTDQEDLDITDKQAILDSLSDNGIQGVVNCAAYTAVDKAEEDQELAYLINEKGPQNLAEACQTADCFLVHISTDYVFSGKGYRPYLPDVEIDPISVYAKSKAAGEKAVIASGVNGCIIRTSWLYSEFGNNFVKTMLNLGNSRDSLNIVADQVGSPTFATDLASSVLEYFKQINDKRYTQSGITTFHYANSGCASWFDFTRAIMDIAELNCTINPISTEEYPLPAVRPHYSILDTRLIKDQLNISIPYWRDSLKSCIAILLNQ